MITPELMDPLAFNVDLAQKTLDYVEANPEKHNQWAVMRRSSCGTVGCIAGWACALADKSPGLIQAQELLGMDDSSVISIFGEMDEQTAKTKLAHYIEVATKAQAIEAARLSAAALKANRVTAEAAAKKAKAEAEAARRAERIEDRRQRLIDNEARLQGIGINRKPRARRFSWSRPSVKEKV